MADKLPPPPPHAKPVKALSVADWAALTEAFIRAKGVFGAGELTAHEMTKQFRDGQLVMAVHWIMRDGSDRYFTLACDLWKTAKLEDIASLQADFPNWINPRVLGVKEDWLRLFGGQLQRWFFFVRRRELDKLYPMPTVEAESESTENRTDAAPIQRKRGKRPKYPWKAFIGGIIADALKNHEPIPPYNELALACDRKWHWQPDEKDVRLMINRFLDQLRQGKV